MNFTREPIIETIISPKEGCKLLVRTSKNVTGAEEYYVDAVEVVSFGRAFFFRSMERPKPFLVPVSDYEVIEVKETRVALKNVSHERSIKIGGGREARLSHTPREVPEEREPEPAVAEEAQQTTPEEAGLESAIGARMEKRRDRRRRRHRRSGEEQGWSDRRPHQQEGQQQHPEAEQKVRTAEETKMSTHVFTALIPPPSRLISESISHYKDKEFMESSPLKETETKDVKAKKENSSDDDEPSGSEPTPLHRVPAPTVSESFTVSSFSPLQSGNEFYF